MNDDQTSMTLRPDKTTSVVTSAAEKPTIPEKTSAVPRGIELRTLEDLQRYCMAAVTAGIVQKDEGEKQAIAKAMMVIEAGRELGLGPMLALTQLRVVQGKVSMSAGYLATRIKQHSRYDYVIVQLDTKTCIIDCIIDKLVVGRVEFSLADADVAQLPKRNPTWRTYPKNMLFARAISNAARWHFADVMGPAQMTVEEADDLAHAT